MDEAPYCIDVASHIQERVVSSGHLHVTLTLELIEALLIEECSLKIVGLEQTTSQVDLTLRSDDGSTEERDVE